MLIDTHIHEKTHSDDSFMSLPDIVDRAKSIGLNGICITDHESNGLLGYAEEYGRRNGLLIIVGAEILTHEGDILVFGLKDLPKDKLYAQQLIDMTTKVGGVCMSAHPFRKNNRGMGNTLRDVKGLSGIEAFNGSTPMHHNMEAFHLARELGIPTFGASDAHVLERVGLYATVFPGTIRDTKDFIEAVKHGNTQAAALTDKGYQTCPSNFIPIPVELQTTLPYPSIS